MNCPKCNREIPLGGNYICCPRADKKQTLEEKLGKLKVSVVDAEVLGAPPSDTYKGKLSVGAKQQILDLFKDHAKKDDVVKDLKFLRDDDGNINKEINKLINKYKQKANPIKRRDV